MLHIEWAGYQTFCGRKVRKGQATLWQSLSFADTGGAHPGRVEWNPASFEPHLAISFIA